MRHLGAFCGCVNGGFRNRLHSLFEPAGRYVETTGGEAASIYNVLKLQHGLPLYQDPRDPPYYATTLYNAGFYSLYGLVTWPFRHDTTEAVLAMRMLTLALFGSVVLAMVAFAVTRWLRRSPGDIPRLTAVAMVAIAVTTLLGPLTGWWVISVRPDIGGAVFAGFGLLCVLGLGEKRPMLAALFAAICLALAWSFKQSIVLIEAGLVLAALVQRQYLRAAILVLPTGITVGLLVVFLGPNYLANIVWAPSLVPLTWHDLERMIAVFLSKGSLPLIVSAAGIASLRRVAWLRRTSDAF